jgi:hypothetical protein
LARREHLGGAVEQVVQLGLVVTERVGGCDGGADARAADVVDLDPDLLEPADHADVCVAAHAPGTEREPNCETGDLPGDPARGLAACSGGGESAEPESRLVGGRRLDARQLDRPCLGEILRGQPWRVHEDVWIARSQRLDAFAHVAAGGEDDVRPRFLRELGGVSLELGCVSGNEKHRRLARVPRNAAGERVRLDRRAPAQERELRVLPPRRDLVREGEAVGEDRSEVAVDLWVLETDPLELGVADDAHDELVDGAHRCG